MRRSTTYKHWTAWEDDYLRKEYPERSNADLAQWLHRSPRAVQLRALKLGVSKTPEFADKQKRKGQFKKGHEPFNKGKELKYWMSQEKQVNSQRGQFKPCEVGRKSSPTYRPVGYECVRRNHGTQYIYIKVAQGKKMQPKHRWVWEQAHGPIPKGYNVQFKDGNTLNCDIDNLYLISRSKQLVYNRHINQSPERLKEIYAKSKATRDATIRRDKLRIKWGLEPESKLVKRI